MIVILPVRERSADKNGTMSELFGQFLLIEKERQVNQRCIIGNTEIRSA